MRSGALRKPNAPPTGAALERLADRILDARNPGILATLLARDLKKALGVSTTLLLWDRKLAAFEGLSRDGTRLNALRPGKAGARAPRARYLIAGGELLKTPKERGEGALLPLMARSGFVGMVVLGRRRSRRRPPYSPREVRLLQEIASRAALSIENHLYEAELIASERMAALGTFAGMLAHDFRGPMTVIRGYAETLSGEALSAETVRSRARLIVQMVDRLDRMTAETLDFAKGGGRLVIRRIKASALVAELLESIRSEVPGLAVEVMSRLPPRQHLALDVDKLRRVVVNIAANARDAMGGKGPFHVEARFENPREGTSLVLELKDQGPGVPEGVRERLFEPFVTHGKSGGTGLGLAVARRFVEDHGGSIELVESGKGACFRIRLPLPGKGR
jgi:signal transduction histidine kinase